MDAFAGLDHFGMVDGITTDARTQLTELRDLTVPVPGTARQDRTTLAEFEPLGAALVGAADGRRPVPDAPGDILYTSGITGSRKGVVVTHDAVLRRLRRCDRWSHGSARPHAGPARALGVFDARRAGSVWVNTYRATAAQAPSRRLRATASALDAPSESDVDLAHVRSSCVPRRTIHALTSPIRQGAASHSRKGC